MIFDLVDSLIRRVFLLFINLLIRNNLQSHFEFIDRIRIIFERDRVASRVNDRFIFHQTFAFFQSNSRVLRSFDQLPPSPLLPVQLYSTSTRRRRKTNLKEGGGEREKERKKRKFREEISLGGLRRRLPPFSTVSFWRFLDIFWRIILPQRRFPPDTDPFGPCLFSSQPFLTTVGPPDT